jgi:hypothetical protein
MKTVTRPHWERLRGSIAVPGWLAIGVALIETLHTFSYIRDHLSWLATPTGNIFLIAFGFVWLFALALWPKQDGKRIEGKRFAAFMDHGQELEDHLAGIQMQAQLPNVQSDIREWVQGIVIFLAEVGFHTEAVVFSQVASKQPSAEQMAAVAAFPEWKQYDLAQLRIYRHRLEHIKEDKGIS